MSKRLSTCTADRLNRCFKSTSACIESPYLETTGVVKSRDLTCPITACQANCNHRRTCVVSKCVVVWKTVPFHDEKLMKNTLYIPETIPSCTETREKNYFYETDFLVSILKISMITSSTTWRSSFTYSAWLMWSPLRDRTMRNVQSPSLKTSDEEFLRKITDFRDYCLFICFLWLYGERL